MTVQATTTEIQITLLRQFGQRAYEHAGLTPDDARTVVEVQLEADLRGVDTHGFERLPWYVERLLKGENNPRPEIAVLNETPASLSIDADNGLGQLVCVRAMEMTLAKARTSGLCATAVRNSNDWGCGAYYPMMAARDGFVAFCTTTSVPTLAPFGGRTRVLGNNPIAFAAPRRDAPPLVLDMALTPVALGKVMRAAAEGQAIPQEWGFQDRDGRPTTDPGAALRGIIPAIGGYKGIGLSVMTNVLAGVLAGGAHTSAVDVGKRGQFFFVMSPTLFGEEKAFLDEMESMVRQISQAELLPGVPEVYIPGEPEQRTYDERVKRGAVPYSPSVIAALSALGESIGIPFAA